MSSSISKRPKIFNHWRMVMIFLIAYDFIAILFSYLVALWVRFDCNFGDVPELYLQTYFKTIFIYAIFCILVFWVAKSCYRHVSGDSPAISSCHPCDRIYHNHRCGLYDFSMCICLPECRFPISYLKKYIEPFLPSCNNADFSNTIYTSGWIANE